jgi:hypothetical protein
MSTLAGSKARAVAETHHSREARGALGKAARAKGALADGQQKMAEEGADGNG